MNLIETTQLLNGLNVDFEIHTKKDLINSKNNAIVLTVTCKDGMSTMLFYDMNCNYIKTV